MKIEATKLEAFCNILGALVRESRLHVTADGITTGAVDPANVAMVRATIPATAFREFGAGKCDIGMDVAKWKGAVNVMKKPDALITVDLPPNGKIGLADGSYSYKIVPLDLTTIRKDPTVPSFQLPNSLEVDAAEFAKAMKALAVVGDKVAFTIKDDMLELATEGDSDHLRKEIPGTKAGGKKNETAARSLFSLDYMIEIAKPVSGAGKVTVSLGIDHPVRLDFTVDEIEASYAIAPRIEQGE